MKSQAASRPGAVAGWVGTWGHSKALRIPTQSMARTDSHKSIPAEAGQLYFKLIPKLLLKELPKANL